MLQMYLRLRVKYPLFFLDCHETWIFCLRFFEKYSNIKFHENRRVGAEVLHADRHDEANSRFSQFWKRA